MINHLFVAPDALCIQQNFSFLITELPDITLDLMDNVLTPTNLTDIRKFESIFRKKAKLLKIILAHRGYACEELFKIISICFKGDFMIKAMKKKSADMAERGNVLFKIPITLFKTFNYGCI